MGKVRKAGARGQGSGVRSAGFLTPDPWPLAPAVWLWPLLGALVLAPLRAGMLIERVPVAAVNALIALALALWAWQRWSEGTRTPEVREPVIADGPAIAAPSRSPLALSPLPFLAAFLALHLLSLTVSIYRHGTLTALLDLAALVTAYWLVAHGGGGRRVVGWVLGAMLAAGLLAALLALVEYGERAWTQNDPGWRAFGPFFNPNLLAATAILLAPVAVGLMLRAGRPLEALAAGGAAVVFIAALLVSGSRGGIYGFGVGLAAFLVVAAARRPRVDRRAGWAALGLFLALLPALWLFRVPFLGRSAQVPGTPALTAGHPAAGASERSNQFRVLTWKATLGIVRDHPLLGTGAGTYQYALPRYTQAGYTQLAHQSYLQIAAETGVPALLAWLGALGVVLLRLLGRPFGPPDWLLPGIAGGLVAAMAHNLVDYSWAVTGTALPFWTLLGAGVALTRPPPDKDQHGAGEPRFGRGADSGGGRTPGETRRAEEGRTEGSQAIRSGRNRKPGGGAGAIRSSGHQVIRSSLTAGAGALLLVVLNLVWLSAAEHGDRARAAMQRGEAGTAVEAFRAAVALTPLDVELWVERASALASVGDNEGAVAACRRAAALAPTWGRPYHRLGRLYERMGRLKEAEQAFAAAAARDPRNTQPLDALAQVRAAQGDHAGALQAHRQIVALAESPTSRYHALDAWTDPIPGGAYEALGRDAEAKGDTEEALRLYRAGADRLRQWRLERPFRLGARQARGEGVSEREVEFQRAEVRLWERLAALYSEAGNAEGEAEARREAAAAAAAVAVLGQQTGAYE